MADIHAAILEYLFEVLGGRAPSDLDIETRLLERDLLDSVGIYDLVMFIEERFAVELLDEEMVPENFGTVSLLAEMIEMKRRSES